MIFCLKKKKNSNEIHTCNITDGETEWILLTNKVLEAFSMCDFLLTFELEEGNPLEVAATAFMTSLVYSTTLSVLCSVCNSTKANNFN